MRATKTSAELAGKAPPCPRCKPWAARLRLRRLPLRWRARARLRRVSAETPRHPGRAQSLPAACFEVRGCFTLLRGKRAALVYVPQTDARCQQESHWILGLDFPERLWYCCVKQGEILAAR